MSILKLLDGQRIHLTVEGVTEVEGKFGPQLKFVGQTPDDPDAALFLNVEPAERQLSRIGYSRSSIVGQTVEVERVNRNGTLYTNINRANGAVPAHPVIANPKAKQAVSLGAPIAGLDDVETGAPPTEKLDTLFNLYDACFAHAHSLAQRTLGNDASHEGISAMAATIFIAAK
jgi:hypothetical protein